MHPALQAALGLTTVALALSAIIARWGGRAQRQESDGRVLERAADATQRHDVTDATMSSTLRTLTDVVAKMDGKLDAMVARIGAHEVTAAGERAKAEAERDRIARLEAQAAQLSERIADVDRRQDSARHALRGEIQAWATAGVDRVATLLAEIAKRS